MKDYVCVLEDNRTCKQGWWKCHSNYRCIPDWQRCNGKDDCRDNSDEEIINCPKCHPTGDFTCANKRCVPKRWMCDFDNDCGDRSDEDPSMCAPLYRQCSETEIRCKNQKCIRRKWLCDHDNDCGDNSDEQQCTIPLVCHNNQFRCDTGHCIDKSFLCDGEGQCPDLSDEKNCSTIDHSGRICAGNKFQCDNNFCVPLSWRCDGDDDCGDQSDESKTSCDQVTCSDERHFRCDNGKCISIWQVCSNITQCWHRPYYELAMCNFKNKSVCSPDQFKCADGACVPAFSVCNNVKDCNDASDEIGCVKIKGQSSCSVNNGGCEQNCTEVKEGLFCSCWKGFKVSKTDGKTCEDIDECATYGHGCPQLCNNVKGSFKCQCFPGFKDVKGQGHDCKPEGNKERHSCYACTTITLISIEENIWDVESLVCLEISRSLFFSTLTEIRRFQPDRKEYSGAVTVASTITSMDIDVGKSLLYWTDNKRGDVLRAPIPDKPDRQGLPQSIGVLTVKPHAVAVDWVENNIYWSDTKLGSISVCLFDGRYQKTIISNVSEPLAIAVNPKLGLLYWTDGDTSDPRIERSWMNGEKRVTLVSERLVRPSALTIDFLMNNRVYWADYKLGVIESMNSDGSERVLIRVNVFSPVSIDVFESKIYWVSQRNGSAHFADKFGFGNASNLQTGLLFPSGVRIFHRLRMDLEIKPRCPRKGEMCSHLCLLRPEGYSCACPDGSAFQKDSSIICDAASEVSKPVPEMCACWNGGECVKLENASYICKCLQGYSGNLCEIVEPKKLVEEQKLPDLIAIVVPSVVVFAIGVTVVVIVLVVVCHKKRKEKSGSAAVYVSEEHVAIPGPYPVPQTSSVDGQQGFISTNFSNPVYETCHGEDPNLFVRGVQAISAHDDDSDHYASAGSVSTIPLGLADSVETFYKRPTLHLPEDDISDYITAGEPKYFNTVDSDEPRHIDVSGAEPRHLDPADDNSGADTAVLVRQNISGVFTEEHSV